MKTKLVATAVGAASFVAPIGALAAVRHSASQPALKPTPERLLRP